jgi:hypothetical protein
MATESFNKNFKVHPSVAEKFKAELDSLPEENPRERAATLLKIHNHNEKAAKALARFSSLHKK